MTVSPSAGATAQFRHGNGSGGWTGWQSVPVAGNGRVTGTIGPFVAGTAPVDGTAPIGWQFRATIGSNTVTGGGSITLTWCSLG